MLPNHLQMHYLFQHLLLSAPTHILVYPNEHFHPKSYHALDQTDGMGGVVSSDGALTWTNPVDSCLSLMYPIAVPLLNSLRTQSS